MGLTIWSAVFTLQTVQDTAKDVSESLNGLIGADRQRQAKPLLAAAGWNFAVVSPQPKEWTYPMWFRQILAATADEYGIQLRLTPETVWTNISDEMRSEMSAGR